MSEIAAPDNELLADIEEAMRDVVDLGLVYGVNLEEGDEGLRINWVWNPPWGPDKITDDGRDQLRALGFTV